MPLPWEAEQVEENWGNREAWRSDRYPDDTEHWLDEDNTAPGCPAEDEDTGGTWRAAFPVEDWPEDLAGPEYWMYKNMERQRPG